MSKTVSRTKPARKTASSPTAIPPGRAQTPDAVPLSLPASVRPVTKVVGVGASAGGLEAFTELVRNLPTDSGLAFVLVQHLDPTHRSLLSELLARAASLPVQEIEPDTRVQPNVIYVIPPNRNLSISGGVLRLSPRAKNSGPARSIDHFLRSLAADQGANAIGVILSGAGSDGARGLKAIKDAGGLTFAQDEASSKYDSMPRSALAAGCVDFVLPPARIASEIARAIDTPGRTLGRAVANARERRGQVSRKNPLLNLAAGDRAEWPSAPRDADLRKIFSVLRTRKGVDFSLYRANTIRRRLKRRLAVHRLRSLKAYAQMLFELPGEVEALFQDLLINVSSFFRNPKVFETLAKKVFPKLVKDVEPNNALRFWVAGCSTGQEPYSLAIAFTEFCEKASVRVPVQIFATDVNPAVLAIARAGRYLKNQLEGLSAERRQRFFIQEGDSYRVQKQIRDLVVFAPQNLVADPPFTRVDLISCRNMLIYIEPALQQKIIPTFHYALRPRGFLVLGMSESIGAFTSLFSPADKSHKIFQRKVALPAALHERISSALPTRPGLPAPTPPPVVRGPEATATDAYREADRLVLARFSPPGVLVDEEGVILQFRGKVQPFLEIPSGKATLSILKLARGSLGIFLQRALKRARVENKPVREKAVAYGGPRQTVNLEVLPFHHAHARCFLVLFEKTAAAPRPVVSQTEAKSARAASAGRRRFSDLKQEFLRRGDELDLLREQHETAVEELQASNEEVQSSNEELQSLNEELETSNEELESANEELTTLNEELATRNSELRESEHRLREQAQLVELAPLLARSAKDRIVFWSLGAEKLYGFSKEEALGHIGQILLRATYPEPLEKIHAHVARHGRWEGEIQRRHKDGSLRIIAAQWVVDAADPQKNRAILEVNSDITARRQAEESLRRVEELNRRILQSTPDCILVMDLAGRLALLNPGRQNGAASESLVGAVGQHWTTLWSGESRAEAEKIYRAALGGETSWFQGCSVAKDGTEQWWDVVLRPICDGAGHPEQLLAVCRNVTDRKKAELVAREEARLAAFRADIAVEVARGGELAPILQQLAQIIVHHTDVVLARIWLADPASNALHLTATAGLYLNGQGSLVVGEGRVGLIAASKRPHVTHQIALDPEICEPDWARREELQSFAGFPLVFESRLLGVMAVMSRVRLENGLLREIRLFADAIALVVQRKYADDERNRLLQEAMEARNAALAASRAKDDFLAALSHELRTPLNPVLLLASDGAENPDFPPAIRATFETIRNNVRLEAKLIDDLLDLTRITHGKLELEMKRIDLNVAITEAVTIVADNLKKAGLTLALQLESTPAAIMADSVRLQQVFWNILNNAAKFTPAGGRITLQTETTKHRRVVVRISDSGVGMSAADLSRVFEAFQQGESRQGGLGLGLTISRQLLQLHHGTIRALSDGVGKGSTFEIELPLAAATDPAAGAPGKEPASAPLPSEAEPGLRREPARKHRLLLVEDHVSTRNTLRVLLLRRNFEVVVAGSVAEACDRVGDGRYDLLISDLGLPDGDGYQLLAKVHALFPDLRAIALSGYGTDDDRARSAEAGFAAHLTKPIGIDTLDEAIAEALQDHAALPPK